MENERLEFLLGHYFDQALSEEEMSELERALLESASARETFWERARWHGFFRQWGEEEWGRRDAQKLPPDEVKASPTPQPRLRAMPPPHRPALRPVTAAPGPRKRPTSPVWWPLAAAAAVALGFFGWMKFSPSPQLAQSDVRRSGIAVLTHSHTAIWADENSAHRDGEVLSAGWLKLKSGALQVEFSRGARVVLQGPAEFELVTDNSAALRRGKLIATVPEPAHGFSVRASNFSVIDYGTQFGCVVPVSGAPEVHVFRGAVGVEISDAVRKELREHQAVRLAEGKVLEIAANPNAFLTEEKLARLADEDARLRLAAWRQSTRVLSQHAGMLAHFDFEKDNSAGAEEALLNRAPGAASETNGAIVGCDWTEGRWPGKSALEFQRSNDRVRLSLPGEYAAMTFLAWLRADSTPFLKNSLLMAEGRQLLGEACWYLFRDGAVGWETRVSPRHTGEQWRHVNSAPVFRGGALGSWRQVVTVFDGAKVTHYFDGKPVGGYPARLPTTMHFGHLDVGNWSATWPQDDPRNGSGNLVEREIIGNFSGRIDELAILSVPLRAEEIQALYEQGRSGEK